MEQCFIGRLLGNKAVESNSNKAEAIILLETVLTFVIIEYARTINSAVCAIQISQAISLIGKSKLVSRNKGSTDLTFWTCRKAGERALNYYRSDDANKCLLRPYLMQYFSPIQVKCDQYWPTRGTETYGLIQVTLLDTVELATYCVRTFALFKVRICS